MQTYTYQQIGHAQQVMQAMLDEKLFSRQPGWPYA